MIFVSKPGKGDSQAPLSAEEHVAEPKGAYAPPPPVQHPPHPAPVGAFTDTFTGFQPAADPVAQAATAPHYAVTTTVVVALLDEVAAVASEQEALGFFAALGRRIAVAHPLGQPANLTEMEAAANTVLAELGWGRTRLLAGQNGIRILHQDWPAQLSGDSAGRWADAFPLILAAIYGRWFGTIGAPDDLQTGVVTRSRKAIELRHGHPEAAA